MPMNRVESEQLDPGADRAASAPQAQRTDGPNKKVNPSLSRVGERHSELLAVGAHHEPGHTTPRPKIENRFAVAQQRHQSTSVIQVADHRPRAKKAQGTGSLQHLDQSYVIHVTPG